MSDVNKVATPEFTFERDHFSVRVRKDDKIIHTALEGWETSLVDGLLDAREQITFLRNELSAGKAYALALLGAAVLKEEGLEALVENLEEALDEDLDEEDSLHILYDSDGGASAVYARGVYEVEEFYEAASKLVEAKLGLDLEDDLLVDDDDVMVEQWQTVLVGTVISHVRKGHSHRNSNSVTAPYDVSVVWI